MLRDDVRGGAGGEDDDPIGERDRFLEIMGDEDNRLTPIARLKGSRSCCGCGVTVCLLEREAFSRASFP